MDFEAILDQAITMLQCRGRLTYGALKRQFQLDDAYLADLKEELIEGQQVAADEEELLTLLEQIAQRLLQVEPPLQARFSRFKVEDRKKILS